MKMFLLPVMIAAALAAGPAVSQDAQPLPRFVWPERMQNPRALPTDLGGQELRATMLGFVTALDVSCSHCHAGGEDVPLTERDFASDANPRKEIARGMIRMVRQLNETTLPGIAGLGTPRVTCYTCHRGATEPAIAPPPETAQ